VRQQSRATDDSMNAAKLSTIMTVIFLAVFLHRAPAEEVRVRISPDGAEMVKVAGGPFTMGDDEGEPDERPAHEVRVKGFWIDRTEVTFRQYDRCVSEGYCRVPTVAGRVKDKRLPVTGVNWFDAMDYCKWAGKRLPTEAEWEKAARGTDGRNYPWGEKPDCTLANFRECEIGHPLPVGTYPGGASPCGALDMAGNVWEWVADWYDPRYYKTSPRTDPRGPAAGKYRVVRGGSWTRYMAGMRSADRGGFTPQTRADDIGFRCATSD